MITKNDKSIRSEGNKQISNAYFQRDLFHYTGCGLDNIYLKGGYNLSEDGESYSIDNLEQLHDCIALVLIRGTHDLSGRELRFLRKELTLTQAQVAKLMGADVQAVARWEKGKSKNSIADRAIRMLYVSIKDTNENSAIDTMLNDISDLDIKEHNEWLFDQNTSWHKCAA